MKLSRLKYYFIAIFFIWTVIISLFALISNNEITHLYNDAFSNKHIKSTEIENAHLALNKHLTHLQIAFLTSWIAGNILLIIIYLFIRKKIIIINKKENELADNEEKFRKYFQDNLAVMMLVDPVTKKIVDANSAAIKFYKFKDGELFKKTIYDINMLPPEEIDARMKKAILNKSNYLSFRHQLADGEIRDVEVYASPFAFKSKKLMSIIVHDITEQKQMENALKQSRKSFMETSKLLETLFDAVPDIVGIHDTNFTIISYNKAGYEFLNKPPAEVIGKKCYHLLGCETVCDKCVTKIVYKTKKPTKIERYEENKGIWLELSGYPVFNDKGELYQVIEHIRDITERKKFIEELKTAKEKAEESERLKSAFLANMSHEIRTPMNAILGFAQLLLQENISKQNMQNYIEIITNSGNHLLNIINDIIDISKIDAGQFKIFKSTFNLNSLLFELNSFFGSTIKGKKDIQLIIKHTTEPVYILSDKTRLNQILINLVGNALKFTEKGFVELDYKIIDGEILFSIKDTGIGMSEEELQFVFDRFRQGDETNKRRFGGTGLGLSISKEFVRLLGGEIFVKSEKNKGTTFYFTIPYEENIQTSIRSEKKQVQQKPHLKNKTILIVEDHLYSEQILIELLKFTEAKILTAHDGLEAIQVCKKHPEIDLVLMDLQLPRLDGLEATKRIKKFHQDIVIIAQTANAMHEDRDKALAAGCDDYIAKPIDTKKIMKLLNKYA